MMKENSEDQKRMNYAKECPQDCPPVDAVDVQGEIFRIVRHCPPTHCDFQTHAETGKALTAGGKRACLRFGLSVFNRLDDAAHQRELFPALGQDIATAMLSAQHGKAQATGKPPHQTWWPYESINRAALFSCVESAQVT